MYENVPRDKRFKIPKEADGFKYVIAEKPGPNDEGSSPIDHLEDLGYEIVGDMSRRKVAMRIPMEEFEAIERGNQERSHRIAKTVASPALDGGQALQGVERNFIEDLPPMTVDQYLTGPDPDK